MKDDLERVRGWAEARIKAGDVPDWSWRHHVELVEAIDAVLHDLSVSSAAMLGKWSRALGPVDS